MNRSSLIVTVLLFSSLAVCNAVAQDKKPARQESEMTDRLPKVGTAVPDVLVYDENGNPFSTGQFKENHTVLVFGCLT